jgi:hypothetical protein
MMRMGENEKEGISFGVFSCQSDELDVGVSGSLGEGFKKKQKNAKKRI